MCIYLVQYGVINTGFQYFRALLLPWSLLQYTIRWYVCSGVKQMVNNWFISYENCVEKIGQYNNSVMQGSILPVTMPPWVYSLLLGSLFPTPRYSQRDNSPPWGSSGATNVPFCVQNRGNNIDCQPGEKWCTVQTRLSGFLDSWTCVFGPSVFSWILTSNIQDSCLRGPGNNAQHFLSHDSFSFIFVLLIFIFLIIRTFNYSD